MKEVTPSQKLVTDSNPEEAQMVVPMRQDGSVVTGRINWSEYWRMQQDMANLIGCHRDILVAIFHVEHLPRDIEEMDAQVALPVRALRDAAKDILQELAGHAREDEDDKMPLHLPPRRHIPCMSLPREGTTWRFHWKEKPII